MIEKTKQFWQTHKQEVFSAIGLFSLFILLIYVVFQTWRTVSGFSGFSFDPLMLLAILYLGNIFSRTLNNQTKILEKQDKLIELLAKSNTPTEVVKTTRRPKLKK